MSAKLRASAKGLEIVSKLMLKKSWSKREKAWYGLAHTSESSLRRFWEQKPITHNIFIDICKVVGANWEEIYDASSDNPFLVTVVHNLPPTLAIKFVGRQTQLENLHQKLQEQDRIAIVAVAGMGGLGKTELAVQYAYHHLADYPGGICWLEGRSEQDIWEQILFFCQIRLGLEVLQEIGGKQLNLKQQVEWCWQNWKGTEPVLVAIDDVVDFPSIKPYLPPSRSRFKVVMTTRLRLSNIQDLSLDVLSREASLELLESDHLIGNQRIGAEREMAISLCEWLGYLPLGLELVGRYLNLMPDLSIAEMLFRLQEKSITHPALVREDSDYNWDLTAQRGVAAAFELSWELLDVKSQRLGKLLSLFGSTLIPWHLVENTERKRCDRSLQGEPFDSHTLTEARKNLRCFHLLQDGGQETYRIHSLIRQFFKSKLEGEDRAIN